MKVLRKYEKEVKKFKVGDQIQVGKYTATCQKIEGKNAIFMLDQYLDKAYGRLTDICAKMTVDLMDDSNFKEITLNVVPWCMTGNADIYFRLPYVGEMFGKDDFYEPDNVDGTWEEQWELMKYRPNRIAEREGEEYEWGWLMNRVKGHASFFALVTGNGRSDDHASTSLGVRPVFILQQDENNREE